MGAERILIVEDDPDVTATLHRLIQRAGHRVAMVSDGRSALRAVHSDPPQLVVLDLGLPSMDGWTVLARIRDMSDVPVLILSVHHREMDKVRGLRLGADDYVTKPFRNAELLARVEALLRRGPLRSAERTAVYDDDLLVVDPVRREVRVGGVDVRTTPTEFRLLHALVSRPGAVLTPTQLLTLAWGDASGHRPERVKFAILRLRRKLGWADPDTSPLEAVRGFGYRYRPGAPARGRSQGNGNGRPRGNGNGRPRGNGNGRPRAGGPHGASAVGRR
jgi:DNA-binding response OmpR family regulator